MPSAMYVEEASGDVGFDRRGARILGQARDGRVRHRVDGVTRQRRNERHRRAQGRDRRRQIDAVAEECETVASCELARKESARFLRPCGGAPCPSRTRRPPGHGQPVVERSALHGRYAEVRECVVSHTALAGGIGERNRRETREVRRRVVGIVAETRERSLPRTIGTYSG